MLRPWTQAARSLARRRGFAAAAVFILGAGIAATTGVFSVVDAVVLKPLPYPNPDRLVSVMEANSSKSEATGLLAPARLEDWNRLNRTFEVISASYAENVTETSGEAPERLAARRVSPRFFTVFGVQPSVGRAFTVEEEVLGGPAAAVISDHLWERRYQRRADVTSQRLVLKGSSYAIVGVAPPDFAPSNVDLWIPSQLAPFLLQIRDARFLSGVGRLKPGVTVAAAQRDLARVQAELGAQFPATDKDWSAQVTDLKTSRVGQVREPLVFLLGSVGLLLVIAVSNTAGLMLTQLQRRANELAIRGSLGATRARVVAEVVQEVLILAAVAIAVAVVADVVLLRVASAALESLPRTTALGIDWRALAVASLCGVGAALVCGGVPAWRATRAGAAAAISRVGRGTSADSRSQRVLVAGQIAVATLLLSSTALMLRSYYNLVHEDPGFDASRTVTFHVGAAWDEDRTGVAKLQRDLVASLGSLPGVTAVGFSNFLPASNATIRYQVTLQGATPSAQTADRDLLTVGQRSVTSGYFKGLGARLVAGSACPELSEIRNTTPKVLVNRRFVAAYASGQNVVGRSMRWSTDRPNWPTTEIVGVVDDIREDNLRAAVVPFVYACIALGAWPDPEYVVRTSADPRAAFSAIRRAVHDVDPSRAVFGLMTLQDNLDATLGQTRLQTQLISGFGLAAVLLAVIGLYGLVALAVTTRRREIGIRIALGADPRRVVWELATGVAWLLASGAAGGVLLTVLAQRQLRAVVFGVAPLDPATLAGAVLGLGLAASIATLLPAWRAARIDPVGAMRDSA